MHIRLTDVIITSYHFYVKRNTAYTWGGHRRFVRRKRRAGLAEEMKKDSAAYTKWTKLNDVPEDKFENGNFNSAPSSTVLQEIRSEYRGLDDLYKSYYIFMEKLQNNMFNRTEKKFKGI